MSAAAPLPDIPAPSERHRALLALGRELQRVGYAFVTVTPETHARVEARARRAGQPRARDLREVFGWNRAFEPSLLPPNWIELLRAGGLLADEGELCRSRVRFASLGGRLYVHSAFPTLEADCVFFGPDTYRFCALLRRWAPDSKRLADVGCGSGAGALCLARRSGQRVLADINPRALEFAAVNAALAGVDVSLFESDVLAQVPGSFDLIIANPPYMHDAAQRTYRDGGGDYGEALSARIVREALPRLAPGGTLIVYTGSAIVNGTDSFLRAVSPLLVDRACQYVYEELDPDVFGEELDQPQYAAVERIAAVGLRITRPV